MPTWTLPLLVAAWTAAGDAAPWPQYHGPDATSVAPAPGLPQVFAAENPLAWKAPLPGTGPSSPIVVGGQVFVTAGSGAQNDRLHLLAFDARDGRQLWHRQFWATGHAVVHPFGGVAISTPASDGRHVVALYSSNDLVCFDLDGNLLWHRGLGFESPTTRNDVGMGSSPLIVGSTVIVQCENQGASFAMGLEISSGQTLWRLARPASATWTSPYLLKSPHAADLVLLQARDGLTAVDPLSGEKRWFFEAEGHTTATGTTAAGDVYLPAAGLCRLTLDAQSHQPHVVWQESRLRLGNCSPIVHDNRVYVIKAPAILVCADAAQGNTLWQLRLKGPAWASPVLAGDHLYFVNHDGLIQVVALGQTEGRIVATHQIDKGILASPAISDGALYVRSNAQLWKFARAAAPNP